jgi:hypothetical protein
VAAPIARRAAVLLGVEDVPLTALAEDFDRTGCRYQAARTRLLAARSVDALLRHP